MWKWGSDSSKLIGFTIGDIDGFNRTLGERLAETSGVRTATRAPLRDRDSNEFLFVVKGSV
jgi:hypothetical protein